MQTQSLSRLNSRNPTFCCYFLVEVQHIVNGKVCIRAKWPIRPELILVSVAWSDWEHFYSPLNGMLVHRRVTPSIKFASTHLYIWVERGTVRVKCLTQKHNAVTPARAQTRAARPGDEHTNHEATAAPTNACTNFLHNVEVVEELRWCHADNTFYNLSYFKLSQFLNDLIAINDRELVKFIS